MIAVATPWIASTATARSWLTSERIIETTYKSATATSIHMLILLSPQTLLFVVDFVDFEDLFAILLILLDLIIHQLSLHAKRICFFTAKIQNFSLP